ncbi:phosphatidylinositol-binding protein scs2 [Sorochytrium milnesiophthora]
MLSLMSGAALRATTRAVVRAQHARLLSASSRLADDMDGYNNNNNNNNYSRDNSGRYNNREGGNFQQRRDGGFQQRGDNNSEGFGQQRNRNFTRRDGNNNYNNSYSNSNSNSNSNNGGEFRRTERQGDRFVERGDALEKMPPALRDFNMMLEQGGRAKRSVFEQYKRLLTMPDIKLSYLDHVRVIGALRNQSNATDVQCMIEVYKNMVAAGFSVPAPVVETIVVKAAQNDLHEVVQEYVTVLRSYDEPVGTQVHAAIANSLRRQEKSQEAIDYIKNVEKEGVDIHQLKRIMSDAHFQLGNKEEALKVFNDFVANETRPLELAKAFGWLANNYLAAGNLEEAERVLDDLTQKHHVRPSTLGCSVYARIAVLRNKLDEAETYLRQEVDAAQRCTFHGTVATIMSAYLKQDQVGKAQAVLGYYAAQFQNFRNRGGLQYSPYKTLVQYFADKGDKRAVLNTFERVHGGRFASTYLIRAMVDAFLTMGDKQGAADFLRLAARMGYQPDRFADGVHIQDLNEREKFIKEVKAKRQAAGESPAEDAAEAEKSSPRLDL